MEVYADNLTEQLKQVCCPHDEIGQVSPVQAIKASNEGLKGKMYRYYSQYIHYQSMAASYGCDVNHIIDQGYGHLVFSLDYRRTVVTIHDMILLRMINRELPGASRPNRRAILAHRYNLEGIKRAAMVICDSEATRADFLRYTAYDKSKAHVVYLGVAKQYRVIQNRLRLDDLALKYSLPDAPSMLHIGHNKSYKNIETILRALHLLNNVFGVEIFLLKVGDSLKPHQRALAIELKIMNRVIELGRLPDCELPLVYNFADVLVFPSLYEGFGLPVLEAMACGTPVVTSNAGSLQEVTGNAGLLTEPLDHEELARKVHLVITDPDVGQQYARLGLERVKRFSWKNVAEAVYKLYQVITVGCLWV